MPLPAQSQGIRNAVACNPSAFVNTPTSLLLIPSSHNTHVRHMCEGEILLATCCNSLVDTCTPQCARLPRVLHFCSATSNTSNVIPPTDAFITGCLDVCQLAVLGFLQALRLVIFGVELIDQSKNACSHDDAMSAGSIYQTCSCEILITHCH